MAPTARKRTETRYRRDGSTYTVPVTRPRVAGKGYRRPDGAIVIYEPTAGTNNHQRYSDRAIPGSIADSRRTRTGRRVTDR